jgi:signal transduction histidine kinase
VTTTPAAREHRSAFVRAWVLTAGLGVGVVVALVGLAGETALDGDARVPWVVLAVAMAAAERYRVHLHVGRETHTFTLAELPTVVGLFLAWPAGVVLARAVGTATALATVHARSPLKLAFNVASGAFEAAVTVVAFRLVAGLVGADSGATYAGALGAMLLGSVVGIVMVWAIIRVVEGERTVTQLLQSMAAGLPLGVANASIALFGVALLRVRPDLVWIALLPVGVLVITYRAYIGQWRNRDALDFLYDTAVRTQRETEVEDALLTLVRRARSHLTAHVAELVAVPDASPRDERTGYVTVVALGPGDAEESRTCDLGALPLELRTRLTDVDGPDEGCGPEEVWVRASGTSSGPLILRVRGPIGNADAFGEIDLEIVRSLTRLATNAVDAAQLAELKAAFLSAVSHELRTPLTVVLGTAATLRAHGDRLPDDRRSLLLERLEHQAGRLDRLLSDLLDLDRLNRGVVEPRRHLVDLVPLAHRSIASLAVRDHEVVVTTDTLVAEVDPGLTERIVENLVKNAVKYTPGGTRITVDLERRGDEVVIAVEDEGTGVPADLRARLLEPFTRLDESSPHPGTGIGLSLVRRFAQLHGGDVRLEDASTGGTRVVVTLLDAVVPDTPDGRLQRT